MNTFAPAQSRPNRALENVGSFLMGLVTFLSWPFRRLGQMKRTLTIATAILFAGLAYSYVGLVEFSGFAAKPLFAVLGCAVFYVVDRYGFNEVDTINHLKEDAHAFTSHLRSYAVIIGCAFLSPG